MKCVTTGVDKIKFRKIRNILKIRFVFDVLVFNNLFYSVGLRHMLVSKSNG